MSAKVKVPEEGMSPNSNSAYKEMNDNKGDGIRYSRGELDLSNDTSLFLVNAQQTRRMS